MSGTNSSLRGRVILVVDDDIDCRSFIKSLLVREGAVVVFAHNGREAITQLVKDTEAQIELVLMDVMMPVMDGLSAIEELRQKAQFQTLPIIAITAKTLKEDRDACMKAGASDYLAKPAVLNDIIEVSEAWLSLSDRLRS